MEAFVQQLGWHKLVIPPSLRLFINGESSLFNCGENTQRFLNEHKLHLVKIKHMFFTVVTPESIGGLIGFLLTLDNISNDVLHLYGPKPLSTVVKSSTSFAKLKNVTLSIHEIGEDSDAKQLLLKGGVLVQPILVKHNENQIHEPKEDNKDEMSLFTTTKTVEIEKNNVEKEEEQEKKKKERDDNLEQELEKTHDTHFTPEEKKQIHEHKRKNNEKENVIEKAQIILKKKKIVHYDSFYNNETEKSEKNDTNTDTICYLIECPPTRGKFHPEKAKKMNVPEGKYFGVLKLGKSVTINGNIIHPEDVCDKNIDGRKALIIDLISKQNINYLIEKISSNKKLFLENVEYVFHLSNEHIVNSENYKTFFLSLKNVKNIKCNQSNAPLEVCPFISSASLNGFLSNLLPTIFLKHVPETPEYDSIYEIISKKEEEEEEEEEEKEKKCINENGISVSELKKGEETDKCVVVDEKDTLSGYLSFNTLTKFVLHPYYKVKIDTKDMLTGLYPNNFNTLKTLAIMGKNEEFVKKLISFNEEIENVLKAEETPFLYFLGTGCSMPCTFRNVSGIILSIDKNKSIALDLGEGSLYQLLWMSKSWYNFISIIQSIKIIFISHIHADHHAGLYYFLHFRSMLFPDKALPMLLIPRTLRRWINVFNKLFIKKPLQIVYAENNVKLAQQMSEKENDILTITIFLVNHIPESYGVKLEHKKIGSIVYSADTRPCDNVKNFSKNCDILIHEATFDDELLEKAIQKKHSTTNEAIQIGEEANCKCLILNHFSQRYPKMPKLSAESEKATTSGILNKIIYSFDYMRIPLYKINAIPQYFKILLNLLEKLS